MKNISFCNKVFYEVVEHLDLPAGVQPRYVYQSGSLHGVASSYDFMIERIRSKPKFQNSELEMIQVESLVAVRGGQSVNPEINANKEITVCAIPTSRLLQLFELHKACGIPLGMSVSLVCKALKINLGEFVESCGYSKNYFRDALSGRFQPSSEFKQVVLNKLGIDPWLYAPNAEPVVLKHELLYAHTAESEK